MMFYCPSTYAQVGNCSPSLSGAYLDVNNVRAGIFNSGALFFDGTESLYEIPKYNGTNALFLSSMWIAGRVNGELRTSASTYGPQKFWPGPLDEAGNPPADCSVFNRIFKVSLQDIEVYESTGQATADLLDWPWELGAPVIDGDGVLDNYNLETGDRPEILGHQSLWWVMNDRRNVQDATEGVPIGLEIRGTAFGAASDSLASIHNTTLYKYTLIYKGSGSLEEAYIGFFVDPDLGNPGDDYVGSDSTLSIGYVYNADNDDERSETAPVGAYGKAPPALGYSIIQGPVVDNDGTDNNGDGEVDEPGERLGMSAFISPEFGRPGNFGDPNDPMDFYRYLQGVSKDGTPWRYGGDRTGSGEGYPTTFMYSGDPVTLEGWSELNPGADGQLPPNIGSDRTFLLATGPFSMQPGEQQEIVLAVVWAKGEDNKNSVLAMKEAATTVRAIYDDGFELPALPDKALLPVRLEAPADQAIEQPTDLILHWENALLNLPYEVIVSTNPAFTDTVFAKKHSDTQLRVAGLQANTTYFWRVRSIDSKVLGPWSDTRQFSTFADPARLEATSIQGFMTVQNAAGPIVPPDMAAFAFGESGFPVLEGNLTPAGSYPAPDRPTSGVQQSTTDAVWGIHTGLSFVSRFQDDNGQSFLDRSVRNGFFPLGTDDFEWRFEQACFDGIDEVIAEDDCLAVSSSDENIAIEIPFSLWNIGATPDDQSDDYRMIPRLCESSCRAGTIDGSFDLGEVPRNDHAASPDDNDPYTDLVYWFKPEDNGAEPGELGYLDFFFGDGQLGDEVFARMVLVNLNGLIDTNGDGQFDSVNAPLPEPGTIFRIVVDLFPAPLPASPADNAQSYLLNTTLYWNGAFPPYQIQIATDANFATPVIDQMNLDEVSYRVDGLNEDQLYFWRVRMVRPDGLAMSEWSEPRGFSLTNSPVSIESDDATVPTVFSLDSNFPNPFNSVTFIPYQLPKPANVQLVLYDVIGRRIQTLVQEQQVAGRYSVPLDTAQLSSGVYYYRLSAGPFTETRSMVVIR